MSELLESDEFKRWRRRATSWRSRLTINIRVLCSTEFLRRIIAPDEGQGGVTSSDVCLHCHRFPVTDCLWWVSKEHGDGGGSTRAIRTLCVGDHLMDAIFDGLQERSKLNITNEPRKFIRVCDGRPSFSHL